MQPPIAPQRAPAFAVPLQARPPADVTALSMAASSSPSALQRLLFLHPKTLVDSWPFPVDTLGEVVKAPSAVYPVLASFVSDLPLDIEIFDGYVTRESFANYKQRLRRADFIAISQMSPLKALDTELTIRLAKALNPQVLVILGGNHASSFPDSWIERGADFVVVGEGEIAFPKLMETILSGKQDVSDVPNLVYRHGDGSRATGVKAAEADLNASPLPRWDLVDFRPYDLGLRTGGMTAAIEVSRGCPHRCDFCNINTYWGLRQRYKSVARVCDEL
jgi:anaerobic magnesium-protoporphyrin IX monomethyl ester cyclase